MKNKYEQSLPCTFAEQLAAYLYDEIAGAEKNSFESHLQNCEVCTNDLADFSALRSSVLQWRETDFAPLQTPVTVLPALRETVAEQHSWFKSLWASFTLSPARATFASILALLVFAGLFWIASESFRHEEVADLSNVEKEMVTKEKSQIKDETVLSPSPSPAKRNISQIKPDEISDKHPADPQPSPGDRKAVSGKNALAPDKAAIIPAIQKSLSEPPATKTNAKPKIKSPRQNDVEVLDEDDEDSDHTLRLADIFSEVGMNNLTDKKDSD